MSPITTCNHPLHPERYLNHALMPHGSALSSSNQREEIMQKLTTDDSNKDEDANYDFVQRVLNMMDKKQNNYFFKNLVTNGYCAKSTKLVSSAY